MKNKTTILPIFIVAIVLSVFFYTRYTKNQKNKSNPFTISHENSLVNVGETLITINNRKFSYLDLPDVIKKELYKEELAYMARRNNVLKSFAVRLYKLTEQDAERKLDEIPELVQLIDLRLDPKLIDQIYKNEKNSFPASMQEWQIKNQISFRLLSDRAYNFYTYVINELYQKKLIKIENPYPITPKEWIEIKNNPVAGTADAKNELVMIGGFLCGTCQKYNLQLLNLLSKKINSGLRFTPIFITNGEDGEFIINKTLYCLNEQNQEFYWEFFNKIIPTIAKSKIQNTKETLNSITALSRDIMKSMSLDTAAFNTCYSFKDNYNKKNQEIRNQLNFIDLNESPIFFLNSKKLDPDGRDLDLVFEESAL